MHGEDSTAAVHFPDSDSHFNGEQKRGGTREKTEDEQSATESFDHPGNINKLCGKTVLYEEVLRIHVRTNQLGIAVRDENEAEGGAECQKPEWLQTSERIHW